MGRNVSVSSASAIKVGARLISGSDMSAFGATPRATYALVSHTSSASNYQSASFLDSEFRALFNANNPWNVAGLASGAMYSGSAAGVSDSFGDRQNAAPVGGETQSQPATNGTSSYPNATHSAGEFGNDFFSLLERGAFLNVTTRMLSQISLNRSNHAFVNSDHADRSKVLLLDGQANTGVLNTASRFRPLSFGQVSTMFDKIRRSKSLVAGAPAGSAISSMSGSASYNAVRKELVVLAYNSGTSGRYDLMIYKGVDFNANGVDVSTLGVPSVTLSVNAATISAFSGATTESHFRARPVLVDNGDVYFTAMFPTAAFRLFKIVRASGDASATLTLQDSLTLASTSYGSEQGVVYGQKTIQSRNGEMVISFCPYYYYGAGVVSFVICKRKSSWARGPAVLGSNDGYSIVPYGDSGFASYRNGNSYASNPMGGYINAITVQGVGVADAPITTNGSIFLPYSTFNGTTNYPVLSQVLEYPFQSEASI